MRAIARTASAATAAARVHARARSVRASATAALRDQGPLDDPDQVARFAAAKADKVERVLDIDAVYAPEFLKDARVLVTGANRGIGLALCKEAAAQGAVVIGACRKSSPELDAVAAKVVTGVDVVDYASCVALAEALEGEAPIDLLINNAGYFPDTSDALFEGEGPNWEENLKQYDICAVGPLRVTSALARAGRIASPGGKVILITSQGGSVTWRQVQNKDVGTDYGHHMGKAAANMCGALLAEELRPKGIAVANIHPGFNRTAMTEKYAEIWDIEGAVHESVGAKRVWHEVGKTELGPGCPFINAESGLEIPY